MSVHEDLSRLLAGECSADEAAALRQRIADDPEVARAWALMQALPRRLRELPEAAPPPALDAAVLDTLAPVPARTVAWKPIAASLGLLAAAAVAALVVRPGAEPASRVLVDGVEIVEGDVTLMAGDTTVDVDGRARVRVVPPSGAAVPDDATPAAAIAALAGATVTVTVIEGTAMITPRAGTPVRLRAGETRTTGPVVAENADDALVRDTTPTGDPDADARIAALQRELAALRFEQAMARGQLAQLEGTPVAWPADLAADLRPDAFRARLDALTDADARWEVLDVHCDEFPCVGFLRLRSPSPEGLHGDLQWLRDRAVTPEHGDDPDVMQIVAQDHDGALVGFAVVPQAYADDALSTRIRWRIDSLLPVVQEEHGEPAPR